MPPAAPFEKPNPKGLATRPCWNWGVYFALNMSPKSLPPPTFGQLFAEHCRARGALLLADAMLILFVFLAPAMLSIGIKIMEAGEVSQAFLHVAGTIDGLWLVIAVGVICLDSTGKLLVITISGWRDALGKKL
jgi:hypothetical protein